MSADELRGRAEPVVLRLTLDRAEPLGGIIERPDGTAARRFSGWVDLMTMVEALIAETQQ